MMIDAVPLIVPIGDKSNAGSGFFVAYSGREWLITAAHLPLMVRVPHSRWDEWPDKIHVIENSSVRISFNLRINIGNSYLPTFAHLSGSFGNIADFIALPVPIGTAVAVKANKFYVELIQAAAGDDAEVVGYPTKDRPWPQLKRLPVTIKKWDHDLVFYGDSAPKGTSGGPLISSDGRLLGMSFGADDDGKAISNLGIKGIIDTVPGIGMVP